MRRTLPSFVGAMGERNVFEALRAELASRRLGFRAPFWLTGVIAFFMSAALDNLTTALVMSAVILAVSAGNARFTTLAFINLVVAANAGGAWCAFGDITTLLDGAWGPTNANVAMGLLSAVVDNIPIMYAVLQMNPPMDHGQWLLVTLACGVVGSLLAIGSATGVALMGVSRGQYTVFGHLRRSWAIGLGYVASIALQRAMLS